MTSELLATPFPATPCVHPISRIIVHRASVPLETAYRWSVGHYYGATKGIVEVHTTTGFVGLGEVADVEHCDLLESTQVPQLLGADAMNIDECERRCVPELGALRNTHDFALVRTFGAIEMALWDIRGHALGVPVHILLGGTARTTVAFSEYFAMRLPSENVPGEATPVEVARYCARMQEEHGSRVFEGKVGTMNPDTELRMVKEVRAALGDDAEIRLDANAGWDLVTARKMLRDLAPCDIANIEDPAGSYREMAKLRQHSDIPFSGHSADIALAAELGVPDTIVLNVTNVGGIRATVKFIAACEAFGIGFWFYSGDFGIGTAAYLQISAATAYVERPHQSLARWYVSDVIEGGPFTPVDGVVAVPSGPGLGVRLDAEALERAKGRFEEHGAISQIGVDDDGRFRRVPRQ
jgi:glucarate dehydratase